MSPTGRTGRKSATLKTNVGSGLDKALEALEDANADFAACVYRHDLIQRQIAGMAVGTTMPSLNNTVMERLFFPFCNPEEQSRIIERLDNLDQFLRYIQYQVLKLRQQKYGLMHDLLTGRVRVKVAETASI